MPTDDPPSQPVDLLFGPFRLGDYGETLYRDNRVVKLGSRARQILMILIDASGEIVSRQDIMERVWPGTTVVDGNLTVHVAALRQALGDGQSGAQYIVNVPGRGYRFVAQFVRVPRSGPDPDLAAKVPPNNLPSRLIEAIGRETAIADVIAKLATNGLVTVTGPAGVGKTTLALHVADAMLARQEHGTWLVDLAPVIEAEHVPAALAAALRLEVRSSDSSASLLAAIGSRRMLLVIDNCEHLIEPVALLVAALTTACPNVTILTTSREPLQVAGEVIYRLEPLACPPSSMLIGVEEALRYPAIRMFAERAAAAVNDFRLDDQDVLAATLICRRLDGLPLAIEFTSPLVGIFGVGGLATRLDEHLRILGDRRGGTPRHRTLGAALQWSYDALEEVERLALRRLAVFAGSFTMDAAVLINPDLGDEHDIANLVATLFVKSLLTSEVVDGELRLRLLETTRAFALDQLEKSGEIAAIKNAHARYYAQLLRQHRDRVGAAELTEVATEIDNVRAAMRWTLGAGDDPTLAMALAVGALPTWFGLSLLAECRARLRDVMSRLSRDQQATADGWDLAVALRAAEMFTHGTTLEEQREWVRAPQVTSEGAEVSPPVTDLLTNWTWHIRAANFPEMMALAQQHAALVADSTLDHDQIMTSWVMGLSTHHIGDLVAARAHLARFLAIETVEDRRIFVGRTGFDRTPGAEAMLGTTLCLMGDARAGVAHAYNAETVARETGKAMPLCEAMIWICTALEVAWIEPTEIIPRLQELVTEAEKHSLNSHLGVGKALQGVQANRVGDYETGAHLLGTALDLLEGSRYWPFNPWFAAEHATALAHTVGPANGLQVIRDFRHRPQAEVDSWCTAELLRAEGNIQSMDGNRDAAGDAFLRAIRLSASQSAVAWEVRATIDLAGVLADPAHAMAQLTRLRARLPAAEASAFLGRIDQMLGRVATAATKI